MNKEKVKYYSLRPLDIVLIIFQDVFFMCSLYVVCYSRHIETRVERFLSSFLVDEGGRLKDEESEGSHTCIMQK